MCDCEDRPPEDDGVFILIVIAMCIAAVVLICLSEVAHAQMPEDQPLGTADSMTTRAEAEGILDQAFALATPTPFVSVLEITSAGNVALPDRAIGVFIAGVAPELAVPPRCRGDLHKLPHGSTLVCFPDDDLIVRARGMFQ